MLLRTVLRHINLLNIFLFGIIAAIAFHTYTSFSGIRISLPISERKASAEKQDIKPEPNQSPSIAEYALIAEQNLFHPERKIPPEKKNEQQLPKPEFVLYGTLVTDNIKTAYLEDLKAPHTTQGRGKRQRTLQLGQNLSGYIVKEIHHDKVLMARGDEIIEVKIGDNKRKKTVETASPAPATQPMSDSSLKEKPKGGGLPPGIVHTEPLPAGFPVPDEKTTSKVKEAIEKGIIKRPGFQRQTEKPQ